MQVVPIPFIKRTFVPLVVTTGMIAVCCIPAFAQAGEPPMPPPPRREEMREHRVQMLQERLPNLSADQKTHILAIYAAADDEMRAAREDKSLSEEQSRAMISRVRSDLYNRIEPVLTEAQRIQWKKTEADGGGERGSERGGGRPDGNERGDGRRDGDGRGGGEQPPPNRRARMLRRYELVLPDLSDDQKAQILAIGDASRTEMDAVRSNETLADEQREAEIQRIQEDINNKVLPILTEAQRAKWQAVLEARRQEELRRDLNLRPGETLEQKQARVLKPYTDVLSDLTAEQQDRLLPIVESTSDVLDGIRDDDSRTEAQKHVVIRRVQAATDAKIAPILTKAQLARWQKAHAPTTSAPPKTPSKK